MKYLPYETEQTVTTTIYCNKSGEETAEDIVKAITTDVFVGKFVAKDHTSITSSIKNDENMFILKNIYGYNSVWQVCGKVSDYMGITVPHLYRVRIVGIMFD